MPPLVTAVIPAYNAESFIAQTVASVLAQTYPEVECVVVDDGSTDGTAAVVELFGPPVRLIRQPNAGPSRARNTGVAAAGGDYVAFLDADDAWLPRKLERQMELLLSRPELGLVYTGLYYTDDRLRPTSLMLPPEGPRALRNTLLLEMPVIPVSMTGLMPRRIFDRIGGFDETLANASDWDFACRVAAAFPVEGVQEPLALYRQHGPGQLHRDTRRMERDAFVTFRKLFVEGDLPPEIARLRHRAYANLHTTLAISYLRAGERARFARNLGAAATLDPLRLAILLGSLAWRRVVRSLYAPPLDPRFTPPAAAADGAAERQAA